MQADYIILGQGICGTLLSWQLHRAGEKVVVIDEPAPAASSRVASGLINPVTGKRLAQSWMFEELIPVALETYRQLEAELGIPVVRELQLLRYFHSREEESLFRDRILAGSEYLHLHDDPALWKHYFNFHLDVGVIEPCWLVQLTALLTSWRAYLRHRGMLFEDSFDWSRCQVSADSVAYGDIIAAKIICCEGPAAVHNPYFAPLPWSVNKGEALLVSIPGLPREYIYASALKLVPWKDDLFWLGASYEWKYPDPDTTDTFRQKATALLDYWLRLPYEVIDHLASERPSSVDYKPFAGLHPFFPSVGILNGMGSKGCSQAPFLADAMKKLLVLDYPLFPEVDVSRFRGILSR